MQASSLLTMATSPMSHRHAHTSSNLTGLSQGGVGSNQQHMEQPLEDSTAMATMIGSINSSAKQQHSSCVSHETLINIVKALVDHFENKINDLASSLN